MKVVFVVSHGELHEGGSVVSVHQLREDAVTAAMKVRTCFDGGWVLEGGEDGIEDFWINGCDYVQITEEKVQ